MTEIGTVWKNRKKLRMGYTTGSCAAAAAKAAARMLFSGERVSQVSLMTPKGILLELDIEEITYSPQAVSCGVRKDAGDDPDVTNGLLICAKAEKTEGTGIVLDGGTGVGRVTRRGMEQAVGEAAINRVPRQMITEAVTGECEKYGYTGGLFVEIFIPGGEEVAKRTFNPRLGIQGGLSVLGTSGIVEPMSEKALTDTIFLEMKLLRADGFDSCYLVPGNYGSDFLREELGYDGRLSVKCSNYIGEALDYAAELGMREILLIGHVGKLIKLAAGVMNTHSREADCRMEVLASHAAMAGADRALVCRIMDCINTTEAIGLLIENGLLEAVMQTVMKKVAFYLDHRCRGAVRAEAILFSSEHGILGKTGEADLLLEKIRGGGKPERERETGQQREQQAGKETEHQTEHQTEQGRAGR